jgi:hypothetical protein
MIPMMMDPRRTALINAANAIFSAGRVAARR